MRGGRLRPGARRLVTSLLRPFICSHPTGDCDMTEQQHRFWDVVIKALGFAAVVASLVVGILQFNYAKEKEFYSQFWNERLRLYIRTLDAAAKISSATCR